MIIVSLKEFKRGYPTQDKQNSARKLDQHFQDHDLTLDQKPQYPRLFVENGPSVWAGRNLSNLETALQDYCEIKTVHDVHVLTFFASGGIVKPYRYRNYLREIAWLWRSLWERQSLPWLTHFVILALQHRDVHCGLLNLLAWSWIFQTVSNLEDFLQNKIPKAEALFTVKRQSEDEYRTPLPVQVQHTLTFFFEHNLSQTGWPAIMFHSRKELQGKGRVQLKKRKREAFKTIDPTTNLSKLLTKMISACFTRRWILEKSKSKSKSSKKQKHQPHPLVTEYVEKALLVRPQSKKAWRESYQILLSVQKKGGADQVSTKDSVALVI